MEAFAIHVRESWFAPSLEGRAFRARPTRTQKAARCRFLPLTLSTTRTRALSVSSEVCPSPFEAFGLAWSARSAGCPDDRATRKLCGFTPQSLLRWTDEKRVMRSVFFFRTRMPVEIFSPELVHPIEPLALSVATLVMCRTSDPSERFRLACHTPLELCQAEVMTTP